MRNFKAFMEEGKFYDIVIQMALREIDSEPLAKALVDQDESVREIIFRNMSKRAVSFLKNDMRGMSEAAPESIRAAQEFLAGLLEKKAKLFAEQDNKSLPRQPVLVPPRLDLTNRNAIITTFCALAEFVLEAGLLPLEGLEAGADNPVFRQGLLMLIEGWDPLLMRSILEKHKASLLRAQEIEFDLLIEGIDSLASKDNSLVMEQKLRALVAGL